MQSAWRYSVGCRTVAALCFLFRVHEAALDGHGALAGVQLAVSSALSSAWEFRYRQLRDFGDDLTHGYAPDAADED
jgi:hypothetical protein